jgi:hypothetical protein
MCQTGFAPIARKVRLGSNMHCAMKPPVGRNVHAVCKDWVILVSGIALQMQLVCSVTCATAAPAGLVPDTHFNNIILLRAPKAKPSASCFDETCLAVLTLHAGAS